MGKWTLAHRDTRRATRDQRFLRGECVQCRRPRHDPRYRLCLQCRLKGQEYYWR